MALDRTHTRTRGGRLKAISEVTACVLDHGLGIGLAVELAKSYKRVLYQNLAATDAFPSLNKCCIGDGYPGVEVIQLPEDHWDYKGDIDLYVFPDLYHGGEQRELESQGKAVWGSRHGDRLEIFRGRFLKALAETGLTVANHQALRGIDALRDHLRDKTDHYVKISRYRGTMETFHWRDWQHDEGFFDEMSVDLGPFKNDLVFYAFPSIDTDIEIGCDTYNIDGRFPARLLVGYEGKDKSYFGALTPAAHLPEQLAAVNEAFAAELSASGYRNFISSEVRIKGDQFYFIDPTRRIGIPSGASQMKLYTNLAEIIYAGAHGELVEPEALDAFVCECVLTARRDKHAWTRAEFPAALEDSVVCGNSCRADTLTCWPPLELSDDSIGWLVHTASTPQTAIQGILDKARLLPDGVEAATESLADLLKEIESGQEQGIPFTSKPLPEPAIVLEEA